MSCSPTKAGSNSGRRKLSGDTFGHRGAHAHTNHNQKSVALATIETTCGGGCGSETSQPQSHSPAGHQPSGHQPNSNRAASAGAAATTTARPQVSERNATLGASATRPIMAYGQLPQREAQVPSQATTPRATDAADNLRASVQVLEQANQSDSDECLLIWHDTCDCMTKWAAAERKPDQEPKYTSINSKEMMWLPGCDAWHIMCEYKISGHQLYDSTEGYRCANCKTVHFFKCEFYIYRDEIDTE
ncbi:Hypothetical predicted protein [Olea europaea subsp. europaea]|uniref:Uncharacterized protein n=1 Tax=Olea europaea subsp. europaea TaxID=158383 RepID=A0A8S0V8D9_OLEEU|nr:Hypothetical predicted protein [Olea europaea subsp. europaea]